MLKDPVCGKTINRNKAHIVIEYDHVAYFLCCPLCQAAFEQNPMQYAKPDLERRYVELNESHMGTAEAETVF